MGHWCDANSKMSFLLNFVEQTSRLGQAPGATVDVCRQKEFNIQSGWLVHPTRCSSRMDSVLIVVVPWHLCICTVQCGTIISGFYSLFRSLLIASCRVIPVMPWTCGMQHPWPLVHEAFRRHPQYASASGTGNGPREHRQWNTVIWSLHRAHGSTAIRGSGGLGRYISPAGELHQLGCGSFACCLRALVGVVRSALCNC